MNNGQIIGDTVAASTQNQILKDGEVFYGNLITDLRNVRTEIANNWEGDTADIAAVLMNIDSVASSLGTAREGLRDLAASIDGLIDTTNQIANGTVDDPVTPTPTPGTTATDTGAEAGAAVGAATSASTAKEKPGFWEWHGRNFATAWTSQEWGDAWDYSGCDSGLDYVGKTVDGILDTAGNVVDAAVDTVGAAVNFVVDGCSEFLGWLFG